MRTSECINCKLFFVSKYKKKYCSESCRHRYTYNPILNRENYKSQIKILGKKKCLFCDNLFLKKSQSPHQKYCSIKCCNKYNVLKINNNKSKTKYYKIRFEIFKRDNFRCQYCGRTPKEDNIKLHCDHIHPKSKKGSFIQENLITSCEECNLGKSDVLLSEHYFKKKLS